MEAILDFLILSIITFAISVRLAVWAHNLDSDKSNYIKHKNKHQRVFKNGKYNF